MGETEKLWIYNGLDCCVTSEVLDCIASQLDNQTRATYEFSKALQAPVLEMKLRGILVDQEKRNEVLKEYRRDLADTSESLIEIIREGIGIYDFNWRSSLQLKRLFYETLQIPPVKKRNAKGEYVPSVDRDALERIDSYFLAQPITLLEQRPDVFLQAYLSSELEQISRISKSFSDRFSLLMKE